MLAFLYILASAGLVFAAPPPERPVGIVSCTPYLTAPILFRAGNITAGAAQASPWAVQINSGRAIVNTAATAGPDFVFEICNSATMDWNSTGSIKYGHVLEPVSGLCLQAPITSNSTTDGFTPVLGICYYGDDSVQVQKYWALDSSSVLHFVSSTAGLEPGESPAAGPYGRNMTPESTTLQPNGTFALQLTDQGTQNALYMDQAAATTTYSTISTFTTSIASTSSASPIYTPTMTGSSTTRSSASSSAASTSSVASGVIRRLDATAIGLIVSSVFAAVFLGGWIL